MTSSRWSASGSLAAFLAEWVDHREAIGDLRATTADSYRRIVVQVAEEFGALRLDRITASDLDRLYHRHLTSGWRSGEGRSARTTRYLATIVSKALRDAVRKGLIPSNPAEGATPPSAKLACAPEPTVCDAADATRFLSANWLPTYRRIVWLVGLQTGLRRGELCGLQWAVLTGDALEVVRTRTTANHEVHRRGAAPVRRPRHAASSSSTRRAVRPTRRPHRTRR